MRIYAWAKNYKHSFISLSHIFTGLSCFVLVFHWYIKQILLAFSVFLSYIHSFIHSLYVRRLYCLLLYS